MIFSVQTGGQLLIEVGTVGRAIIFTRSEHVEALAEEIDAVLEPLLSRAVAISIACFNTALSLRENKTCDACA